MSLRNVKLTTLIDLRSVSTKKVNFSEHKGKGTKCLVIGVEAVVY